MRILAFGTYDVRTHPRIGVLIEGLRAHGDEVVEVNVPLGIDTAGRVAMLRQPWRLPLLVLRLLRCWAVLTVRGRRAWRRQRPDAVLVGYLGHFDVQLAQLLFPRAVIALDHLIFAADTARDRGESRRWMMRLLDWLDRRALRAADVILVDSAEHATMVPADLADRSLVVPVGAGAGWFAAGDVAAPRTDPEELRVIFFGLFTPLQGAPTIGRALGLLADEPRVRVTMVGGGQQRAETRRLAAANPRVEWRDWEPSTELAALVAAHDVCLGIVGTGPKAARVVPNKVYQGAAAGCVVVTSDTRPQRAALGDAARFVPPGDAEALAEVLRGLAADPGTVGKLRAAARDRARERFAAAAVVGTLRRRLAESTSGEFPPMTAPAPSAPPLAPRAWLRYDVVQRLLDELRPETVLEIGCGQGAMGARLARRARYLGVEPDQASCQVAAARVTGAGGTVVNGDHTTVPVGSTYDLVCAFEVLEHLRDDGTALKEWAEFVRPGGQLMLSVPAFGRRFGPMDIRVGHYRRYDPDELAERLLGAGLTAPRVEVYGWPLGYALEAVRNRLDRRHLAAGGELTPEDRTAASGRHVQPTRAGTGRAIELATLPFRYLQRLAPTRGTGLVAVATRPG